MNHQLILPIRKEVVFVHRLVQWVCVFICATVMTLLVLTCFMWQVDRAQLVQAQQKVTELQLELAKKPEQVCPGWLYNTDLKSAQKRICKGYSNGR